MLENTDTRFFTNTDNNSLLDRFKKTLKHAQYFDVLVGYFRTSGFYRLYQDIENIQKVRILVGINTDRRAYEIIEESKKQKTLDFESHQKTKEQLSVAVQQELENSEDTRDIQIATSKFIEFIKNGKIEFRAFPSENIHAKVYITRYDPEEDRDFGRVITGSSNFSEAGFCAQREFNVELKDSPDVKFALARFEELWEQGVDISQEYIETIETKTWLSEQITPYQLYLKLLYEHYKKDLNANKEMEISYPNGFMELNYQTQAVSEAQRILDEYNGVFLADVVGLGKTFMTSLLLQQIPGKKLILCPPVLKDYWDDTARDFFVRGHKVESIGKIDKIINKGYDDYDVIVIDEAHRFRNEMTKGFESLHKICKGKKVILVSATPLNNKLDDILNLIKLFQPAKKSDIPGIPNLESFFKKLNKDIDEKINQYGKGSKEHINEVKIASNKVRDKVLSHIMIRRTRHEIKQYFSEDIQNQGLFFPELENPQRIIYKFDNNIDSIFNQTIELLQKFSYSRYTPSLFLKEKLEEFDLQKERNMGGFIKGILVKRLESSFYAFKKTISRFLESYEKFIKMYNDGTVYISKTVNVFDLLDQDNEARLLELVDEDRAKKFDKGEFKEDFITKLSGDLEILYEISKLWEKVDNDPKIEEFIRTLKADTNLKDKKLIIFTESKETSDLIFNKLNIEFNGKVFRYSSEGGNWQDKGYSIPTAKDIIADNYDPAAKQQKDDIKILITTDVLAEGINLHRSNIIINYDLPWNPTRVLQRVGRVNRVGTKHTKVFVYNFFPTAQSDFHLGLEDNIIAKIQAFHNTLGEDAKYLSSDEEIVNHKLFGKELYNTLNDKKILEGEEEQETGIKYYHFIKQIQEKDVELFDRIKRLPRKARTCRNSSKNKLITFFKKGKLEKFILCDKQTGISEEIDFVSAAKIFECEVDEKRLSIPNDFFELLAKNKEFLEFLEQEEDFDISIYQSRGRSNEKEMLKVVKFAKKAAKGFTEEDETFLNNVIKNLELGSLAKKTMKVVVDELKKTNNMGDPFKILGILKHHISDSDIELKGNTTSSGNKKEVILSEYLLGDN